MLCLDICINDEGCASYTSVRAICRFDHWPDTNCATDEYMESRRKQSVYSKNCWGLCWAVQNAFGLLVGHEKKCFVWKMICRNFGMHVQQQHMVGSHKCLQWDWPCWNWVFFNSMLDVMRSSFFQGQVLTSGKEVGCWRVEATPPKKDDTSLDAPFVDPFVDFLDFTGASTGNWDTFPLFFSSLLCWLRPLELTFCAPEEFFELPDAEAWPPLVRFWFTGTQPWSSEGSLSTWAEFWAKFWIVLWTGFGFNAWGPVVALAVLVFFLAAEGWIGGWEFSWTGILCFIECVLELGLELPNWTGSEKFFASTETGPKELWLPPEWFPFVVLFIAGFTCWFAPTMTAWSELLQSDWGYWNNNSQVSKTASINIPTLLKLQLSPYKTYHLNLQIMSCQLTCQA